MSTALEIGSQLVQKFNNEGGEACVDALYADDVVSIEGQGTEEMPARMEGIDAIRGKNQWWYANTAAPPTSAGARRSPNGAAVAPVPTTRPRSNGPPSRRTTARAFRPSPNAPMMKRFWARPPTRSAPRSRF